MSPEELTAQLDLYSIFIGAALVFVTLWFIVGDRRRIDALGRAHEGLRARLAEALEPDNQAKINNPLADPLILAPDLSKFVSRYAAPVPEGAKRIQLLELPTWLAEPPVLLSSRRLPAIQTSLGVLGTFLGIAFALGQSPDWTTSAELVASAKLLWKGMSGAFNTSIWGLGLAILTMWFALPPLEKRRNRAYRAWLTGWEEVVYWPNPSRLLAAQPEQQLGAAAQEMSAASAAVKQSVSGLNASVGKMSAAITKLAEQQQTDSAAMLKSVLDLFRREALDPLTTQLERTSTASETALDTVKALKKNLDTFQHTMNKAHEAVETQLDAFQKAYLEKFQKYLDTANTQLAAALDEHRAGINLVVQNLREATKKEATARTELVEALTGLTTDMVQKAAALKEIAVELKLNDAAALANLVESGKELAGASREMARQISRVANANSALQETQQSILGQQQELLRGSGQEIASFLDKLQAKQREQTMLLDQSSERISRHLIEAAGQLAESVSDLRGHR